jgi:hypothetical protein
MSLNIAAGPRVWAAMSPIPTCSSHMEDSQTEVEVQDGYITVSELPGICFEGKSDLSREMQTLNRKT